MSILVFVFVFGVLIFIHEFGHFILAKKNGVRVEKFSFGFGPKLYGKKIGQTEYLISAVPLGGYIKMAGDEPNQELKGAPWEFLSKSCGQRAQIVAGGSVLNFILAFFLFSFIFVLGSPTLNCRVGQLMEDYPAKAAGVKEGDLILAVDGKKVEYWPDLAEIIHGRIEGEVVLDIERGDQTIQLKLIPKVEDHRDIFGQEIKTAFVGIYPSGETTEIKYGWGRSFYEGGKKLINLSRFTCKALWLVLTRRLSFKESFTGPIGIFYFTTEAARMGFIYLLNLMGLLSMSLAIFNFLPMPVLDGGHLFFLLLEKLRRKPVNARTQELAHQAGMLALLSLMLFVFYNDLMKFGALEKVVEFWNRIIAR